MQVIYPFRICAPVKSIHAMMLTVSLLAAFGLAHDAYAVFDLDVDLNSVRIEPITQSGSDLLRASFEFTNEDNVPITLHWKDFVLLDSKQRKYEPLHGLIHDHVSYRICNDTEVEMNPGLSRSMEVCFEVPRRNFEYNFIRIYDGYPRSDFSSIVIDLVERSSADNEQLLPTPASDPILNSTNNLS